jgi:hypothetical protein
MGSIRSNQIIINECCVGLILSLAQTVVGKSNIKEKNWL